MRCPAFLWSCCAVLLALPSCDIINPEEEVPSFIRIDSFSFKTEYATQGFPSFDIPDAHVYVDNKLIGIYELPAQVPVMKTGRVNLVILPGIRENTLSIAHRPVRIYRSFDTSLNLEAGKSVSVSPRSSYRDNVRFAWMEDFEDRSNSLVYTGRSSRDSLSIIPAGTAPWAFPAAQNSAWSLYGELEADDSFKLLELKTFNSFNELPVGGRDVYVELDYYSNLPLQTGLFKLSGGLYEQVPLVLLPETGGLWRKVYLNLNVELASLSLGTPIELYFGIIKQTGFLERTRFGLDNLKLSYLN